MNTLSTFIQKEVYKSEVCPHLLNNAYYTG